jgi:hypothetical protein
VSYNRHTSKPTLFGTKWRAAQPEIKDAGADPSTDDFLAREKAVLGDDANQFATSDDANAFNESGGDLIGGGNTAEATFESQFPDLTSPSAVSMK